MPVSEGFVAFVLEQLDPLGPITSKRMFGGVGLYAGDLFFALVAGDVLYLKADETTRVPMEKAGAHAFQPSNRPKGKGKTQYFSVPVAVLEDADKLLAWATRAIAVARASHASHG